MDMHQFWRRKSSVSGNAKEIFYALWELAGFKPGILYDITMTYLAVLTEFTVDAIEGRMKSLEAAGFIVKTNTGRGKFQIEVKNPLAVQTGENDLQDDLQNARENHGQNDGEFHRENPRQIDAQNDGQPISLPDPPRADHAEAEPRQEPPKSRKSPEKPLLAAAYQNPPETPQNKLESPKNTTPEMSPGFLQAATDFYDRHGVVPGQVRKSPEKNIAAAPQPKPVPKPKPPIKKQTSLYNNSTIDNSCLNTNCSIGGAVDDREVVEFYTKENSNAKISERHTKKQCLVDSIRSKVITPKTDPTSEYLCIMIADMILDGKFDDATTSWDVMKKFAMEKAKSRGAAVQGLLNLEFGEQEVEKYRTKAVAEWKAQNPYKPHRNHARQR